MVISVGRNPERKEENNNPDGMTVHNHLYSAEFPMAGNIAAVAPEDAADAAAQAAENAAIHALQDAAPMMSPGDGVASGAPSESLGEIESQDALAHGLAGSEESPDAPVDDDLSEASPDNLVGAA